MIRKMAIWCCAVAPFLASTLPSQAQKIMVSSHIGDATIVSLTGVNSDRAAVTFRRELDDEVETCVREGQAASEAACAKMAKKSLDHRTATRRAYCSRATLYTEFGNYSMVAHELEVSTYDGKTSRMVRTDWKDHGTEKLIGNCGGCNTPQLIDTFRILCPKLYAEIAKDGELY